MKRIAVLWAAAWLMAAAPSLGADPVGELDPEHLPAVIGETLAQVLARWGEKARFGADCGSWNGRSVDLDMKWNGGDVTFMALLQGERITGLRVERRRDDVTSFARCEIELRDFQNGWQSEGIVGTTEGTMVYDGPVMRTVHPATRGARSVGTFEADYRASRTVCKTALILSPP